MDCTSSDFLNAGIPNDLYARVEAAKKSEAYRIIVGNDADDCSAVSLSGTSLFLPGTSLPGISLPMLAPDGAPVSNVCSFQNVPTGTAWAKLICRNVPTWGRCFQPSQPAQVEQLMTVLLQTAPLFSTVLIDPSIPGAEEVVLRLVQAGSPYIRDILPLVFTDVYKWSRQYRSFAKKVDLSEIVSDFEQVCLMPSVSCKHYVASMQSLARVLQQDLCLQHDHDEDEEEDEGSKSKKSKKSKEKSKLRAQGIRLGKLMSALTLYAARHGLYYGPLCSQQIPSIVKTIRSASKSLQPVNCSSRIVKQLKETCFCKRIVGQD